MIYVIVATNGIYEPSVRNMWASTARAEAEMKLKELIEARANLELAQVEFNKWEQDHPLSVFSDTDTLDIHYTSFEGVLQEIAKQHQVSADDIIDDIIDHAMTYHIGEVDDT